MTITPIMSTTTRQPARSRVRGAARRFFLIASIVALGGCAEEARRSITTPGEGPLLSVVVPEGMSLQCPPGRGATARTIAAGGEHDDNGNGIVCDVPVTPSVGVPTPPASEPPPAFTIDDAPYPATP